jgi:hypothetical protein
MDSLKKILGIIFALLFISTAVPALIFFNFDRRAFTAETYQKAFANANFYNKLPVVMADAMLASTTDTSKLPVVMRGMSQDAWKAFFRTMLPPETLKVMGDDILNSSFAYLNMQTNSVQLSLIPLKSSMVSDTGVQAVFSLLNSQPDCTLGQIAQMAIDLLTKSEMQFCKPPSELIPMLTPAIQEQMQVATLAVPDQITLISAPTENDPRVKLATARMVMRLSPIFPLGFLLLMTIFTVNSLKGWLSWWGIPLSITGVLASLMSLGGAPIFGAILQRVLVNRMPAFLPTILLGYASDLASAMLQALLRPVLWQGLLIAFIGLIMAAGSYFIRTNFDHSNISRSKHVQQ